MSGLIDLLIAFRILAGPLLVGLLVLFFYHSWVYASVRVWKREAQDAITVIASLNEKLADLRNENQRINSKLNSAKKRIRRQRRKQRRKANHE